MYSYSCNKPVLEAGFGPPQQKSVGCMHMLCLSFLGESGERGFIPCAAPLTLVEVKPLLGQLLLHLC